jgi:pilus assembly protein CpaF
VSASEDLRFRPDRIILGEVRGTEARTLLDSFNTGHAGSLATIHANSAAKALTRFANLGDAQPFASDLFRH